MQWLTYPMKHVRWCALTVCYSLVHNAQLEHFDATPSGCDDSNGWGLIRGGIEQLCHPTGAVLEFGFNGYACDWTQWLVEQNYFQRLHIKWKQFWLDQWTSHSLYLKCTLWTNLHQFTLSHKWMVRFQQGLEDPSRYWEQWKVSPQVHKGSEQVDEMMAANGCKMLHVEVTSPVDLLR